MGFAFFSREKRFQRLPSVIIEMCGLGRAWLSGGVN